MILLTSIQGVGKGDGTDWQFEILQFDEKIFEHSFQDASTDLVSMIIAICLLNFITLQLPV